MLLYLLPLFRFSRTLTSTRITDTDHKSRTYGWLALISHTIIEKSSMNTVVFVNAAIGFSENLFLVVSVVTVLVQRQCSNTQVIMF